MRTKGSRGKGGLELEGAGAELELDCRGPQNEGCMGGRAQAGMERGEARMTHFLGAGRGSVAGKHREGGCARMQ